MPPEETDPTAGTDPGSETPPSTDPPTGTDDDWKSPESKAAALADLKKERDERKALQAEIDKLREASLSDKEREIKAARAEAAKETAAQFEQRIAKQALKAAATGKFADPSDAALFVDLTKIPIDDNGDPDEKALEAAIADVLKQKPHLAATASKPPQLPGSGFAPASGSSGDDMNSRIRKAAGRA